MKRIVVFIILILGVLPALASQHLIDFNAVKLLDTVNMELDLDYQINIAPAVTIGPKIFFSSEGSIGEIDQNYYGFGISAFYKFHGGWYLNAGISHVETKTYTEFDDGVRDDGQIYNVGIGYHWLWDVFSLKLGLSYGETNIDYTESEVVTSTGSGASSFDFGDENESILDIIVRVGWAF